MTARNSSANAYLRFVELAGSRSPLPQLQPDEERLFRHVALAYYEGENLSVRTLMARRHLGSPATIHTRLKTLRASGWVMLADTADSRRKQVLPTPGARRHLSWLSRCVLRASSE
jgi:hypothetical protein